MAPEAAGFGRVVMVDWSAASVPTGARADSIWLGEARGGSDLPPLPLPTRRAAEAAVARRIDGGLAAGERVLVGFDFAFGYPAGFAARVCGSPDAVALWDWLERALSDDDRNRNDRFALADRLNRLFPPGGGPFWGRPAGLQLAALSTHKRRAMVLSGLPEHRHVELALRAAGGPGRAVKSVWQLHYTGSVGSQVLTGLPVIARLRRRYGRALAVWPFEAPTAPVVVAEIYPALIDAAVRASALHPVRDARQVALLAHAIARLDASGRAGGLFRLPDALCPAVAAAVRGEEGWILGAGHHDLLAAALADQP
jgi:hypothetical protein